MSPGTAMFMRGKVGGLLMLLAATALSQAAVAAQPVTLHGNTHRVIRAAIISTPQVTASPYVFYVLGSSQVTQGIPFAFYPPKPPGWEFVNPLAQPGLLKSDAAYWTPSLLVSEDYRPLLSNFDLILLCIRGNSALLPFQQRMLAEWVQEGGLLWIDNQSDTSSTVHLDKFFAWWNAAQLRTDGLVFENKGPGHADKFAADATHPLLKGLFQLSDAEIDLLGIQDPYPATTSPRWGIRTGVGALSDGSPQFLLQEVVRETDGTTTLPSIAAARLGKGAVVVTSCGVAQAISAWYEGLRTSGTLTGRELPEWSVPDAKLVYNMIEWAQTWASGQSQPQRMGGNGGELTAPLAVRWRMDRDTLTGTRLGDLGGSAVIDQGLLFFGDSGSRVRALDLRPERDLDDDGSADDGPVADFTLGTPYDEVWNANLAEALGPGSWRTLGCAAGRVYQGGGPVPVVAVVARAETGLDGYLAAYRSGATDPAAGSLLWSAQITGDGTATGRPESGPVVNDNLVIVATNDSTENPEVPRRDSHLLAYDLTGPFSALPPGQRTRPQDSLPKPTVSIPLASAGTSAEIYSPPAIGYVNVTDAVTLESHQVQVTALAGNTLPRIGNAAVGRLFVAPLMVQFAASGWDRAWLKDLTQADTAANQAVRVYIPDPAVPGNKIQIPPHVNDDPSAPLNYVRQYRAGQIEIIFTRWSLFSSGRFQLPVGFGGFSVEYADNTGQTRSLSALQPQLAARHGLRAVIRKSPFGSPCMLGDTVYVGSDSINAAPNRSIAGSVSALRVDLTEGVSEVWKFYGDERGGPLRRQNAAGRDYEFFSDFSFTPAYSGDTLYVASNYRFSMNPDDPTDISTLADGVGVLYALDLKAWTALLQPGTRNPVLPMPAGHRLALQAPPGQSADPNQTVAVDSRGTPIWVTSNLVNDNARDAIPQRTGLATNWTVDFMNGIVRLGPGAYGKYSGRLLRVRYFTVDASGGLHLWQAQMQADSLVRWAFYFVRVNPRDAEQVTNWQIVSPPVVSGGTVHVVVTNETEGTYVVSFPETPTAGSPPDPVWTRVDLDFRLPTHASLSADGDVLAGTFSGVQGSAVALANPSTLIADSARLVEAKSTNSTLSMPPATYYLHQEVDAAVGARSLLEIAPDQEETDLALGPGQQRVAFVTQSGRPGVTRIPPGAWRAVVKAAASGGGRMWARVSVLDAGGNPPTPVFPLSGPEGPPTAPLPRSMAEVVLDVAAPGLTLNADDRIYLEIFTETGSGATLRIEGGTFARVQTPIGGPAQSQHLWWAASAAAEYSLDARVGSLGIPRQDSYADRVLKGFSHPSRVRRLPDGNLLVCDTGNNRVVEIDRQGAVVWQYPDSDVANSLIPAAYRAPTPESQRLLAPTDVQRYRRRTTETITVGGRPTPVTVDWVTTLIADSGNSRLVEIVRPLINGRYNPVPEPSLPDQVFPQMTTVIGPAFGVSRPFYFNRNVSSNPPDQSLDPTTPGASTTFSTVVPGGTEEMLLLSFRTDLNQPGLASIPEGVWAFSFAANADTPGPDVTATIFFRVYRTDAAGNKVGGPILETQPSPPLTAQLERMVITEGLASAVPFGVSDRLLVEVYATVEGPGQATVYFHYGHEYKSRIAVPVGSVGAPLMLTAVDRTVVPTGPFSTVVMAAVANHPPDPTPGLFNACGDRATSLVSIALARDAAGNTIAGVLARHDGVNLFKARDREPFTDANSNCRWDAGEAFVDLNGNSVYDPELPEFRHDFMHARQVERIRVWEPEGGETLERVLVVDDAGVKFFDAADWNDRPVPAFEMRAKPTAATPPAYETSYEAEMADIAARYPSLEYSRPENAGFFPACARFLPDGTVKDAQGNFVGGRFLIVNSQPRMFAGGTAEVPTLGPAKSEVLEVDPGEPAGKRILHGDGRYFILPDPFSLAYPSIAGAGTGLRQPLWAER